MVIEKGEKYRIYAYYICTRSTWYTQTYLHITYILHCIIVWQHIPLIANTSSLRPRFSHKAYIIIFYVITLTLTFNDWYLPVRNFLLPLLNAMSCDTFSLPLVIYIACEIVSTASHHIVTYLINHAAIYTYRVSCVDGADAI